MTFFLIRVCRAVLSSLRVVDLASTTKENWVLGFGLESVGGGGGNREEEEEGNAERRKETEEAIIVVLSVITHSLTLLRVSTQEASRYSLARTSVFPL